VRSDAFKQAVESRDPAAISECLAEEVSFRSPVTFQAYEGKQLVATILTEGAMKVFSDFSYSDRLEDGDTAVLIFQAQVGEREVDGIDILRFDGEGKVRELMVMVRPMSGVHALAEAMGRRFEDLQITPAGH
jgi:hypothetical protein